ncbi:hypothetical protein BJ138DRAFT_1182864 [Hygrophoropsis aurantiaca]|uniref:Uncharacterized protein n=1 Tax=Hygrophoropsis aurantiaca TaxID=72124 RepID=A0ACB8A281_9AGAM|nr:hypothetical protein BJ138DRAFT_1182864 [Hygrophoropsis aurantiaca]
MLCRSTQHMDPTSTRPFFQFESASNVNIANKCVRKVLVDPKAGVQQIVAGIRWSARDCAAAIVDKHGSSYIRPFLQLYQVSNIPEQRIAEARDSLLYRDTHRRVGRHATVPREVIAAPFRTYQWVTVASSWTSRRHFSSFPRPPPPICLVTDKTVNSCKVYSSSPYQNDTKQLQ